MYYKSKAKVSVVRDAVMEKYRSYARIGLLTALSAAGAMVKIPSPVGSIALDSAAGYFAALVALREGAIVAALGHIFSAYTAGFPLGALHIVIAAYMAFCATVFGLIARWSLILAAPVAIFLNGVAGAFIVLPIGGMPFVLAVMPFLTVASAVNVVVASAAFKSLRR